MGKPAISGTLSSPKKAPLKPGKRNFRLENDAKQKKVRRKKRAES
jgi:hypothetical protein